MTAKLHEKMRTTKKPLGRGTDIISQTSPLVKGFFAFFCIFLKVFCFFQPYIYTRARGWLFVYLATRFSISVIALSSSLSCTARRMRAIGKKRPNAKNAFSKTKLIIPLRMTNMKSGLAYVYPFTVTLPFFSLILILNQTFALCKESCLLRSPDSKYPTKSSSA